MSLSFKVWTKENKTRVYINTRFCDPRLGLSEANNGYFYADENGKLKASWPRSWSGLPADAVKEVMKRYEINENMLFADLLSRLELCQTKNGNFSESKYFKLIYPESVA